MSLCPILSPSDPAFQRWQNRRPAFDPQITATVAQIIDDVQKRGAEAVLEAVRQYDAPNLSSLFVTEQEIEKASVSEEHHDAIKQAIERVTDFHEVQLGVITSDWEELAHGWGWRTAATERPGTEDDRQIPDAIEFGKFKFKVPANAVPIPETVESGMLGQRLLPMQRVGIYVPGGKASYPSSVIMNAVPAKVAKVPEIVIATPPHSSGSVSPAVLVAAREIGITKILKAGGAQAIAAMALGIDGLERVDKIAGPGSKWVNEAKRQLWGSVGLDAYAGPSEVCVFADKDANPKFAAADLLSQIEHAEDNCAMLVCFSEEQANQILEEAADQMAFVDRRETLRKALTDESCVVIVTDYEEAAEVINAFAPEHLALHSAQAEQIVTLVRNAGCIGLGGCTAQSAGDFASGPSHTLPTSGAARFAGPVSVQDFLRLQSLTQLEKGDLKALQPIIQAFGEMEGFPAHANAASIRLD